MPSPQTSFSVRVSTLRGNIWDGQLTFSKRGTELYEGNAGCQALGLRQRTSTLWGKLWRESTFFFFFLRDSIQSMKTNAEWPDCLRPERMPFEENCRTSISLFHTGR